MVKGDIHIVGAELSHQRAPLAVRERTSLGAQAAVGALHSLQSKLPQVMLLATCNRLSVYAYGESIAPILEFFKDLDTDPSHLSVYAEEGAAINALFSTAAGLQSQALGEHEILGQIKKAHAMAQSEGSLGPELDELIRRSITTGKRVRKETTIGQTPVSLASVGYHALKKRFKHLEDLTIAVLGTGEMANLMLNVLGKGHKGKLHILSRSMERAQTLAGMYNAQAHSMDDLLALLPDVDVVVGCTQVHAPILGPASLLGLDHKQGLTLLDLGLPRNFNPALRDAHNIYLLDLDDIKASAAEGLQKRHEALPFANKIIAEETESFLSWRKSRKLSPLITSYYSRMTQIEEEELAWAMPKLGSLDEAQRKVVEALISRITRRVSGKPIEKLKAYGQNMGPQQSPIDTFKEIFDL